MATSLKEQLTTEDKRKVVIDDALEVLEAEVKDKGGLSGVAVKTGYKMVKGLKPGFVRNAIDHLLDEFLDALDPIYQEALGKGVNPGDHLKSNKARVADALLSITDGKAERSDKGALKKTYAKLRPTAQKHVEAAAPRLADMLNRHAALS